MHIAVRVYHTGHVEARQHPNGSERGPRLMLGSQKSHYDHQCHDKKNRALLTAARASGGKDECQARLTGIEREYWMGTKISRLGGHGFRGTVTRYSQRRSQGGGRGSGHPRLLKRGQGKEVRRRFSIIVSCPLACSRGTPGTVTIPQCRCNITKQHTQRVMDLAKKRRKWLQCI